MAVTGSLGSDGSRNICYPTPISLNVTLPNGTYPNGTVTFNEMLVTNASDFYNKSSTLRHTTTFYLCDIFNTFIASRANRVVDSVFFVLFYTFILWPISVILADVFVINIAYYDTQLITFVPYIDLGNYFNRLIEFGDPVEYELRLPY